MIDFKYILIDIDWLAINAQLTLPSIFKHLNKLA